MTIFYINIVMDTKVTNRLDTILDIMGRNQTWLADKTGMDVPQISRIVNGREPRLRNALKICRALDLPVEKVFSLQNGEAA